MEAKGNLMNVRKSCLVAAAVAGLLPFAASGIEPSRSAEHRRATRRVDSTDFYLFNSYEAGRDGYVTLLANYIPLQQPYGGPNYFAMNPSALYEIHVDNDGDAKENLTFQFRFTNRLANDNRGIKLNIGGPNVAVPLKNVGGVSAADNSSLNFRESYQVWLTRGDRRLRQRLAGHRQRTAARCSASPTTSSAPRPSAAWRTTRRTRTRSSTR